MTLINMAVLIDSWDNIIYAPDLSSSLTIWKATCAKSPPQGCQGQGADVSNMQKVILFVLPTNAFPFHAPSILK